MIVFSLTDIGSRDSNLDLISRIKCQDGELGVLIMDGYNCLEDGVKKIAETLSECCFNGDVISDIFNPCKGIPVKAAVCLVFKIGKLIHIYSAGDCRVYNKKGELLTEDDSAAWAELKSRKIDADKIPHLVCFCPNRNNLTSFVDFCCDDITLKHTTFDLSDENQMIMLCTDGFWEHVEPNDFIDLMSGDVGSKLKKLKDSFPNRLDNHSVCVVDFSARQTSFENN
ncbi:hypothetical protein [Salmonella enterica]|uniref:hypothetical protein n=1 Tax=Salmonella enterica TaxID=28901 RepID=UPI0009ACEA6B|nr:hypothetical protein [Salmonella enterica]